MPLLEGCPGEAPVAGSPDAVQAAGADAAAVDSGAGADTGGDPDAGEAEADADLPGADAAGRVDAGPSCGNGVAEGAEACDGTDLKGETCAKLGGYTGGTLSCSAACSLDKSRCTTCGDGVCGEGESLKSCPAECAATSVAAGAKHACLTRADGSVWCWGAAEGHLMGGVGDADRPVKASLPKGFGKAVQVAAGEGHTCALDAAGKVACWGRNGFGEAGAAVSAQVWPPAVVAGAGLPAFGAVAAGAHHTCAMGASSKVSPNNVWCWGRGDFGAVASGFVARNPAPVNVKLAGLDALAAGGQHTCALKNGTPPYGGELFCWGSNTTGELNTGDTAWAGAPPASGMGGVLRAGAGAFHTCADVKLSGLPAYDGLWCWGANDYGQLGAAPSAGWLRGQKVWNSFSSQIVGGRDFTCVIAATTSAPNCFGRNSLGQLGDGTKTNRYTPAPVSGVTNATQLAAGKSFACALLGGALSAGTVRCWGQNNQHQLGDGTSLVIQATPVAVVGL